MGANIIIARNALQIATIGKTDKSCSVAIQLDEKQ